MMTALDAIYTHGLQRSACAYALQMQQLQYDLTRDLARQTGTYPTNYGSPSAPQALRCAYCATYFVPAGRSCGCGANRPDAASMVALRPKIIVHKQYDLPT